MTEDEKEELIYRLWDEFNKSIGPLGATDERKYAFIAGARAALYNRPVTNDDGTVNTAEGGMMVCEHDLAEMDTAAHWDGLCPLCLKAKVERLQAARSQF